MHGGVLFAMPLNSSSLSQSHHRHRRWADGATVPSATNTVGGEDYFSRTIVNEPGRDAGCTSHPALTVTLQPSPRRAVPSSGPVRGTESVDPSAPRRTPLVASRRPH
jgi:hypothetical protein